MVISEPTMLNPAQGAYVQIVIAYRAWSAGWFTMPIHWCGEWDYDCEEDFAPIWVGF